MSFQKYLWYLGTISLALSLEMVICSLKTPPLRAQPGAQPIEISLRFPTGGNIGAPNRTGGAGKRGPISCLKDGIPLTAVAPINNGVKTLLLNPTLYVYVPQTKASSAEFILVDDNSDPVYSTTLALKNTPGIVSVSLPDKVTLTPGKEYTWHFAVVCNPINRERDEYVRGLILPTTLDLISEEMRRETGGELTTQQKEMLNPSEFQKNLAQLKTNPQEAKIRLQEQAEEYSQVGVWSETLTIFTQLSQAFPDDCNIANGRKELFKSVELDEIAEILEAKSCR